jgi:magnesium chelatase family protein
MLDRIDLQVEVSAVSPDALMTASEGESTAVVAVRVAAAQKLQRERQGRLNAELIGDLLAWHCRLDGSAATFLQSTANRLAWSARSHHRVVRIARTIADLAQDEQIGITHIAEAVQYRRVLTAR